MQVARPTVSVPDATVKETGASNSQYQSGAHSPPSANTIVLQKKSFDRRKAHEDEIVAIESSSSRPQFSSKQHGHITRPSLGIAKQTTLYRGEFDVQQSIRNSDVTGDSGPGADGNLNRESDDMKQQMELLVDLDNSEPSEMHNKEVNDF